MATKRKQPLKVFCTPIGFHDAYVAAPSQKAALEAWGAKTNLFAQGAAHLVTDERLAKVPIKHPGEVIKVLRGSDAEQLAALDRTASAASSRKTRTSEARPKAEPKRQRPKPSRAKLTSAEETLTRLEDQHAKELRKIEAEQRRLERKRRELEDRQSAAASTARERLQKERDRYQQSIRDWSAN